MKIFALAFAIISAVYCATANGASPGNIVLVGIPKTGSSYLHLNMQHMLEELFDYSGGRWPDDIHQRRVTSRETGSTLVFDHTCLWHTAPARSAVLVKHLYKRRFASADKIVVLVRDEVQVLQSAYDYFDWKSTKVAKRYGDEQWHKFVLDQYASIQSCYKPFKEMMLRDNTIASKVFLVHFDEMVADCDSVMNSIAYFLFDKSSSGYKCRGKEDSKQSRIPPDRSRRSTYSDPNGGLARLHSEARIDWTKLFDRQNERTHKAF